LTTESQWPHPTAALLRCRDQPLRGVTDCTGAPCPYHPHPAPLPSRGEGARASVHLTLVFGRSDFRCMARDRARPRTQVLYTSLSGAGEIFDGWREKIPAPPLKPCTFVHNRALLFRKACKRRESKRGVLRRLVTNGRKRGEKRVKSSKKWQKGPFLCLFVHPSLPTGRVGTRAPSPASYRLSPRPAVYRFPQGLRTAASKQPLNNVASARHCQEKRSGCGNRRSITGKESGIRRSYMARRQGKLSSGT